MDELRAPVISRNAPCVCGSGRRFKSCCGKIDAGFWSENAIGRLPGADDAAKSVENEPQSSFMDDLPRGVFVSSVDLLSLPSEIVKLPTVGSAKIIDSESGRANPQRVTDTVALGTFQAQVSSLVENLLTGPVATFYGVRIASYEEPHILRYNGGGYYRPHSDNEAWDNDSRSWERVINRDISILVYLDSHYLGGELVFPNFRYRLQPRPGMVVAFPSDHRYLHGAMPVLSGTRHAVVSWATIQSKGTPALPLPPRSKQIQA